MPNQVVASDLFIPLRPELLQEPVATTVTLSSNGVRDESKNTSKIRRAE
jgi:hypothetical protein